LTNVYKLTDAQIERYSRQIIVPHLGGRGQQRILASRIMIAGDPSDTEAPLAYLVGAGVGTINLRLSREQSAFAKNIAAAEKPNPDVSVTLANGAQGRVDLALLILGTEGARKLVDDIEDARALVIARLDAPGKIAIIPETQGSRVIDESMLVAVGARAEAADFIAMLATTEAFRLIAGYDENPSRAIIEFDGYETRVRPNP
jgi:hypothetical protein